MIYMVIPILILFSYYTFTYGLFILKKEKNKLAASGVILLALLGTIAPVALLIARY